MNKFWLKKQYMMYALKKEALIPTSALVYTLSNDGNYYIVGRGFTSLSAIEIYSGTGNKGSGLDSSWTGGDVVIPSIYNGKPVKAIAPGSLSFIKNIINIYIQDGITHIGTFAFYISSVKNITIPNSVIHLGSYAFQSCSSLESITIPNSVTSIANLEFYGCLSCLLFDFRKATQVPTMNNINAFENTSSSKKIVVPDSLYDSWKSATNWSSYSYEIRQSIIKASDYEASL